MKKGNDKISIDSIELFIEKLFADTARLLSILIIGIFLLTQHNSDSSQKKTCKKHKILMKLGMGKENHLLNFS